MVFLDLLNRDPQPTRTLQGLLELLSRPFWERVWIIQEISKAKDVRVLCGRSMLDLEKILQVGARHTDLPQTTICLFIAILKFRTQEQ